MADTKNQDDRIAKMKFSSVYPHYVTKIEKKGKNKEELHQLIEWLTGFNEIKIKELVEAEVTFETFFQHANIHPNASLIKGVICGYRVEEITNELTQKVRYLDKIIDELAKGKKLEKIMRTP